MYTVTKTYGHELGLSACFRQWRAESHCKFLHGYPLSFELIFAAETLDARNWVINFGSLKPVKKWLEDQFDHKTVVAKNDPQISVFKELQQAGLIQLNVLEHVGCEAFAKFVYDFVENWLEQQQLPNEVVLLSVKCAEHATNSATYHGDTWVTCV